MEATIGLVNFEQLAATPKSADNAGIPLINLDVGASVVLPIAIIGQNSVNSMLSMDVTSNAPPQAPDERYTK
jgi:hypothetical protein